MPDFPPLGNKQRSASYSSARRKAPLRLQLIARHVRSLNFFYLLSGVAQVLLGAIVTMVSILNLVSPMWLAAFLSLLGCVVTMLGVYQVYEVLNSRRSVSDLARDAIERAIQDRN
ncbi:MAG: hypothetical protein LAT75_02110 [Candidatus Cyclonatronum sp.]|uniref:hypothetical protein n=1 Tax=Cyclonatronum sp. TaxID=3024185 RepID=UPI0025C3CA22|nr:hypothetical protein [Cyclonatronum sp.]MCC5932838.1 hypothetical protein [Balneolales bacterium]MCH8485628.1 hypothetical protein [Cyclonatronum sp.]